MLQLKTEINEKDENATQICEMKPWKNNSSISSS